jgi:hypothetical protein
MPLGLGPNASAKLSDAMLTNLSVLGPTAARTQNPEGAPGLAWLDLTAVSGLPEGVGT